MLPVADVTASAILNRFLFVALHARARMLVRSDVQGDAALSSNPLQTERDNKSFRNVISFLLILV